jgi:hypothetical protein
MQRTNSRELSVEEMCNVLMQYLLNVTAGTEFRLAAVALGADPEGISFAGLLQLLYQADIPPAQFFAEVLRLWEDAAGPRRTDSLNG